MPAWGCGCRWPLALMTYPLFWVSEGGAAGAGQKPEVAPLAQEFLRIAGWGMIPALLVMALKSYLSALERTQVVLWTTIWRVGVNFVIAYALIFGHWGVPELGVRGGGDRVAVGAGRDVGGAGRLCGHGCPSCGNSTCSSASGGPIGRRWAWCSGWAGRSA